MPEAGGPTTQSGLLYQNTIAALYLGDLINPSELDNRQRVVEVRPESPTPVDDIVITYADAHRSFVQAKERVRVGKEWYRGQLLVASGELPFRSAQRK
jgi:hypothetical protein